MLSNFEKTGTERWYKLVKQNLPNHGYVKKIWNGNSVMWTKYLSKALRNFPHEIPTPTLAPDHPMLRLGKTTPIRFRLSDLFLVWKHVGLQYRNQAGWTVRRWMKSAWKLWRMSSRVEQYQGRKIIWCVRLRFSGIYHGWKMWSPKTFWLGSMKIRRSTSFAFQCHNGGIQWGDPMRETNLGGFCFVFFILYFWVFWGLYYSKMVN